MSSNQFKHFGVICEVCKNMPIGTLWKCSECASLDLCTSCHGELGNRHGHRFWRIQNPQHLRKIILKKSIKTKHPVICDKCRSFPIVGIRWKCMRCVDFDLCSKCYHDGKHDILGHPFRCTTSVKERWTADENCVRHHGVSCGNCSQSPIIGTRWKCAQCADFDLCPSCYNLGPDQHRHRHCFWRIESPQNLKPIIANDLQTRHAVNCSVCNRNPILGIRWNCNKCTDFNLCSECYHDNKHTSFDSFGHRFCCITTSNLGDSNVSQTLMRSNLSLLEPEPGPSRKVMIGDSASSADNDSPTTTETTTDRRDDIANTSDDYRNELPSNSDASQSNADSDQIQSTNSIDRNASQASIDTNMIAIQICKNLVIHVLKESIAENDPRIVTTSRPTVRQSHIADHDSDRIESSNSSNHNASQESIDTNLIAVRQSKNLVAHALKESFAFNDPRIVTTARPAIRQSHIADHDSDRIESTNSNNRNASQASIDTNLIAVGTRVVIKLDFETVLSLQRASGCDLSGESLKDCMEHVGTVTQIKENGNVLVRYAHTGQEWLFNSEVLTRLELKTNKMTRKMYIVHDGVTCDACAVSPIIGTRWKCAQCADFDLCSSCHNLGPDRHQHPHRFWRIQAKEHLALIIANNTLTRHGAMCNLCHRGPIFGIRWQCGRCTNFNLCSGCYHAGKHFGHRFRAITATTATNNNNSNINNNGSVSSRLLEARLRPIYVADRDSDRIESTISNNHNASQASIDTNLIAVRQSKNLVVHASKESFADNDPRIATTSRPAIRQSHIADHDSDRIESSNSNNHNASQASIDTNLICVGTRVKIELDFDTVMLIQQESRCDWSAVTLMDCMEQVGTVTQIKENGNVLVRYAHTGQECLFNPVVLTRLADQSGSSQNIVVHDSDALFADNDTPIATTSSRAIGQSHIADHDSDQVESMNWNNRNASQASIDTNLICVGSRVKIELDLETVQLFQQASGCDWSYESLKDYMEGIGTVTHINENGNAVVRYAHIERSLICNPVVLSKFTDQSGPSEDIVVYNLEALFADNDSLPSTKSERNHITNIDENEHNLILSAKNYEVAQYTAQLAKMQQELEKMKDEVTCPICIEARKNIIFQCGHGVCSKCNDLLREPLCPICRKQIQQRIPFY